MPSGALSLFLFGQFLPLAYPYLPTVSAIPPSPALPYDTEAVGHCLGNFTFHSITGLSLGSLHSAWITSALQFQLGASAVFLSHTRHNSTEVRRIAQEEAQVRSVVCPALNSPCAVKHQPRFTQELAAFQR